MPAEAKEAYVLSPSDLSKIRSYVQMKYAAMPQEKKAEIVADAVTRIIDRQLPQLEEAVKKQMTAELIRRSVLKQQSPVRPEDIMQACLKLNRRDELYMEAMRRWVQVRLGVEPDKDAFAAAMDKLLEAEKSVPDETVSPNQPVSAMETLRTLLRHESADQEPESTELITADVIVHPSTAALRHTGVLRRPAVYVVLCVVLLLSTMAYGWSLTMPSQDGLQPPVALNPVKELPPQDGLPSELRYTVIDEKRLSAYLTERSSVLAEEPYMTAIIETAEKFDIHPLLLFAITGQEQGFVPTTNKQAKTIANNPFNVFHSWKEYNTDIYDSAAIASRTIVRLSKGRPEGYDPIDWINREYAEDPNWSKGVKSIFKALQRVTGTPG